jgi:hypothetical protein
VVACLSVRACRLTATTERHSWPEREAQPPRQNCRSARRAEIDEFCWRGRSYAVTMS